jgi:hypothetical protein
MAEKLSYLFEGESRLPTPRRYTKTHHTAAVFAFSSTPPPPPPRRMSTTYDSFKDIKEIVNARVSQKVNNPKHYSQNS